MQKKVLIKRGIELVNENEIFEANDIINELMSSSTLTDQQKEQCQTIMSNANALHNIGSFGFNF